MTEEQVLTVPRAAHFEGAWPQGFRPYPGGAGERLIAHFERTARYVDRAAAEVDRATKQLIPYCAITCGDAVFCVERLAAQGERRLHGKLSVGIGGHINPTDGVGPGVLRRAMRREVEEEVILPTSAHRGARFLGLINDDATSVGSVHVGLVFRIAIPAEYRETVEVREIRKMAGAFRSLAGFPVLWQDRDRLESWSRVLVGELLGTIGSSDFRARDKVQNEDDPREDHRG
jgi:predicted NUDIX family phosphoesterase